MPELALHILDLVQNSVSAGATRVVVTIAWDTSADTLLISIEDDGKGMPPGCLRAFPVPSRPRAPRKVGLGIPLFKQLTEMCRGELTPNPPWAKGRTQATFTASHMDLPPMGDLKGTMETLIIANPERPDFCLVYRVDKEEFVFDTAVVREAVGGLPLGEPEIVKLDRPVYRRKASAGWSRPGPEDEKTRARPAARMTPQIFGGAFRKSLADLEAIRQRTLDKGQPAPRAWKRAHRRGDGHLRHRRRRPPVLLAFMDGRQARPSGCDGRADRLHRHGKSGAHRRDLRARQEKVTYVKVNPDMVPRIAEHVVNSNPVTEYTIGAQDK